MKQNPLFSFTPTLYDELVHYFIKRADIIMTFYDSPMSPSDQPERDSAPVSEYKIIRRGSDHVLGKHGPALTFGLTALAFAGSWGISQHFIDHAPSKTNAAAKHHPLHKKQAAPLGLKVSLTAKPATIKAIIPHFAPMHFNIPSVETTAPVCHGDTGSFVITGQGKLLPTLSSNFNCPMRTASTAKVVTMLMILEAVKNGQLSLEQKLPVSRYAASLESTKLGLTTHNYITVEDVLKGLGVFSANDAAEVGAEALAGTEAKFGKLATNHVHALGANTAILDSASGLPHTQNHKISQDKMSPQDLARIFAYAINEFPGDATHPGFLDYLGIKSIKVIGGIPQETKTHPDGNLPNQDKSPFTGKTGDTDTGGKARNIVIVHRENGQSVIVVVMGANQSLRAAENIAAEKMKNAFQILTGHTIAIPAQPHHHPIAKQTNPAKPRTAFNLAARQATRNAAPAHLANVRHAPSHLPVTKHRPVIRKTTKASMRTRPVARMAKRTAPRHHR